LKRSYEHAGHWRSLVKRFTSQTNGSHIAHGSMVGIKSELRNSTDTLGVGLERSDMRLLATNDSNDEDQLSAMWTRFEIVKEE